MDKEKRAAIQKAIRTAHEFFKDTDDWFLPSSQRENLMRLGLNPVAIERYFRLGGTYETLSIALEGVDVYA